jgi:hypothetical protein
MTALAGHPATEHERNVNHNPIGGSAGARHWQAHRLTTRLIELIEQDGLSVAAAARTVGIDVAWAGTLVQLCAIAREAEENELEDRLDAIQALCAGEDWWSYAPRQLDAIVRGEAVPNRIVRELALRWCTRNHASLTQLSRKVGMDDARLRRALGASAMGPRRGGGPQRQKILTVECATRIVRALGVSPCEVPGL